ncbi:MAG: iron ABC transporter permease [Thiothrix sp.]|nr:MAG: iron ABC transporter permease [Thiothrix sp.]
MNKRSHGLLLSLFILLLSIMVLALGIGAVEIPTSQVLLIVAQQLGWPVTNPLDAGQITVLIEIRAPRVALGILVGAGLAITGATIQGLFRNPLADPGLMGVSSGAALAAVSIIVLGATLFQGLSTTLGHYTLPLAAFIGSLLVTGLVYRLANVDGRTDIATMLLAGIAINALLGAATGLLTYAANDTQLRTLTFWLMGSLGSATWAQVLTALPLILLPVLILPWFAPALNAVLLGEAEAGHLGFNLERLKQVLIVLVALIVGTAVALTGVIGFVGLVVPHLLRLAFGPDHRLLLPASALLGASLLLLADLIARTVVTPAELPIGIITALLGGPFFLWLLNRYRYRSF